MMDQIHTFLGKQKVRVFNIKFTLPCSGANTKSIAAMHTFLWELNSV